MGPVEEGGKVATGLIDALRSQPLALALIIVNIIYIGVGLFIWHQSTAQRAEFVSSIIKQCLERPTTSSGFNSGVK